MSAQRQYMFLRCEPYQVGSQQWATSKIEWSLCLGCSKTMRFQLPLPGRQFSEIHYRQREVLRLTDQLKGPTIHHRKGGAQNLMAFEDLIQCILQHAHVEWAGEMNGGRNVVRRTLRL